MIIRAPRPGLLVLTVVSAAMFVGLAAWGWGGWDALMAHPARAGACLVVVLASLAAAFTGLNLAGFTREDSRGRWVLVPATLVSLAMAGLPAYLDRRDLGTL